MLTWDGEPRVARVFANEHGETTVVDLQVPGPPRMTPGGVLGRILPDVPVTTMHLTVTDRRRPAMSFHPAPRRQVVVVLHGAFEIKSTDGSRRRFGPGDCLLADDVTSRGHTYEDVGELPLVTMAVGLQDGWQWPEADAGATREG